MMDHSRSLVRQWGGGTVILSPRDLSERQLLRLAGEVKQVDNGEVIVDPQFYLPHADHERLVAHKYWPQNYETGVFWTSARLEEMLEQLLNLNMEIGASAVVLPGLLAQDINQEWLFIQEAIIEKANELIEGEKIITLALSADSLRSQDNVSELIEAAEEWPANGYYLVLEHPRGQYLVDDPNWLASVLDLVASLKLRGRKVILGYCNQQMLIAACAKADAIASGTWMNVRSFPPDKFRMTYDEEIKQRATWYYCPRGLSEYKIPFLDIAYRQRVLSLMAPEAPLDDNLVSHLFGQVQPSTVGLSEQSAFRHYLQMLMQQATMLVADSFDETVERYENMLSSAEDLLGHLSRVGVRGQHRDFGEFVDVNRAALEVLKTTHGPMLRRRWAEI